MPARKNSKNKTASSSGKTKGPSKKSVKAPATRKSSQSSKVSKKTSSRSRSTKGPSTSKKSAASKSTTRSSSSSRAAKSLKNVKKNDKSIKSYKRSSAPSPKKKNEGPVGFFIRNIEEFEHSIDFDIPRGILAGFLFMLIAEAISLFGIWMNKFYYTNIEFSGIWSSFIAPVAGQIPWSYFLYSAMISFFVGFIYAFFYHMVRVSIHGHAPHKKWVKGLLYGVFLTFVVGIPTLLNSFLILAVPDLLVVSWFAESVMTYLAGGVTIAMIMK